MQAMRDERDVRRKIEMFAEGLAQQRGVDPERSTRSTDSSATKSRHSDTGREELVNPVRRVGLATLRRLWL